MPEFFGPLTHLTLAGALWLIPLLPLSAAAFHLWIGVSRFLSPRALSKEEAQAERGRVANVAILAMVLAFVASGFHLQKLLDLPEGERFLLDHVWRLVRFGQLDANLDLLFDPLSATMCLVLTGVGALVVVAATKSMEKETAYWRFFAWIEVLVFALLLLVLADNFVAMFFGWQGVALATWGLVGFWWKRETDKDSGGIRSFLVGRFGDGAFLLGAGLLFWGLGGVWSGPEYVPDLNPRFSSVAVGKNIDADDRPGASPAGSDADDKHRDMPKTTGKGQLTLTSYPGALVFMDDSRTPLLRGDQPLRAPFVRFPISGGLHSFRIHPGGGLDDYLVAHVALGGEREVSLAAFGPTLTFAQMRDQLVTVDAKGEKTYKNALLAKKGWGGMALVTLACLLLFLAAATKAAQIPFQAWLADTTRAPIPAAALLCSVMTGASGVYMITRLGFLFGLSGPASATVATVGALTAVFGAFFALRTFDRKRALACAAVAQLGLMTLAVGTGSHATAILHLITVAFAIAGLFVAGDALGGDTSDLRSLGGRATLMPSTTRAHMVATLAITAAPLPFVAGFWSGGEIVFAAGTSENIGKITGFVLSALALVACAASSLALWRVHFLTFAGKAKSPLKLVEPTPALLRALWTLALMGVGLGAVLGASSRVFGGSSVPFLEEWLEDSVGNTSATFARASGVVRAGFLVVTFLAALAAWSIAKKRYGADRPDDWEAREANLRLLAPRAERDASGSAVASATEHASGVAAAMDRWVLDGIVDAVAALTRAAAWMSALFDDQIVDRPIRALASGALQIAAKVRTRFSRKSTKAAT